MANAHWHIIHAIGYACELSFDAEVKERRTKECIELLDKAFIEERLRARLEALEEAAHWCEKQTGDFQQYFTPENAAQVIRAMKKEDK